MTVLIDMIEHVSAVPDTGEIRAELITLVDRAVTTLGMTLMGRVMRASSRTSRPTRSLPGRLPSAWWDSVSPS